MTTFSVDVRIENTDCDLWVAGELDVASADELADAGLLGLGMDSVDSLVIDLGAVTFLDSSGIGALIRLRNEAVRLGTNLHLRHVPDNVLKIFEITGLVGVFSICEEDAQRPTETSHRDRPRSDLQPELVIQHQPMMSPHP
jgi:anti-sigma B factor antagonist